MVGTMRNGLILTGMPRAGHLVTAGAGATVGSGVRYLGQAQ
jgi:hypothetical protein